MEGFFENMRRLIEQHELLKIRYQQLEKMNASLTQENEELKVTLLRSGQSAQNAQLEVLREQNTQLLRLLAETTPLSEFIEQREPGERIFDILRAPADIGPPAAQKEVVVPKKPQSPKITAPAAIQTAPPAVAAAPVAPIERLPFPVVMSAPAIENHPPAAPQDPVIIPTLPPVATQPQAIVPPCEIIPSAGAPPTETSSFDMNAPEVQECAGELGEEDVAMDSERVAPDNYYDREPYEERETGEEYDVGVARVMDDEY